MVWITGASSGLGEQLAIAAAAGGARGVIISGRREDALERVRRACEDARPSGWAGGADGVRVLPFDVGDLDFVEKEATSRAVGEFGTVDALVLNAGVRKTELYDDLLALLCRPVDCHVCLSLCLLLCLLVFLLVLPLRLRLRLLLAVHSFAHSFGVAWCLSCRVRVRCFEALLVLRAIYLFFANDEGDLRRELKYIQSPATLARAVAYLM